MYFSRSEEMFFLSGLLIRGRNQKLVVKSADTSMSTSVFFTEFDYQFYTNIKYVDFMSFWLLSTYTVNIEVQRITSIFSNIKTSCCRASIAQLVGASFFAHEFKSHYHLENINE